MGRVAGIESPSNPLVRDILRSLDEHTHFLLEGEKPILEAVAAGLALEHVLHDASVRPGRLAARAAARPRLVSRAVLERHRGLEDAAAPARRRAAARRAGRRDPRAAGAGRVSLRPPGSRATSAPSCAWPRRPAAPASPRRPVPPTSSTRGRSARAPGAFCGSPFPGASPSSRSRATREAAGRVALRRRAIGRRRSVRRAAAARVRHRRRRRGTGTAGRRLPLPRPAPHDPDAAARRFPERRGGDGAPALLGAALALPRRPRPETSRRARRDRARRRAADPPCGTLPRETARRRSPTRWPPAAGAGRAARAPRRSARRARSRPRPDPRAVSGGAEHGDLDPAFAELFGFRGGNRGSSKAARRANSAATRVRSPSGDERADAAAELAGHRQRDEEAARRPERLGAVGGQPRGRLAAEMRGQRLAREPQQIAARLRPRALRRRSSGLPPAPRFARENPRSPPRAPGGGPAKKWSAPAISTSSPRPSAKDRTRLRRRERVALTRRRRAPGPPAPARRRPRTSRAAAPTPT